MKDPEFETDGKSEGGILSTEQADQIREAARVRQANYRARKDREKAKRHAEADARNETPHHYWSVNRSAANQTRIAELQERQEYVSNLLRTMSDAMTGAVSPDLLFLDEVDADVKTDVAEHGICEMEVYLLEFWKRPEMISELTLNEATKVFVKYGIVTAVPGHRLHAWQTWLSQVKS